MCWKKPTVEVPAPQQVVNPAPQAVAAPAADKKQETGNEAENISIKRAARGKRSLMITMGTGSGGSGTGLNI